MTAFATGNQLLREGKLEEAIASYQKAIEENPRFALSYQNLGETLEKVGRIEEAITAFRQAVAISPESPWSLYKLGVMLNQQGQFQEGVDYLHRAIALKQDVPEFYLGLGTGLVKLGQLSEAVDFLDQVGGMLDGKVGTSHGEKVGTFHGTSLRGEAYFYLAEAKSGQQEWSEAVEFYRQSWEINPGQVDYCIGWTKALGKLGQWEEAVELYRQAVVLSGESGEVLFGLGQALQQLERWDEAVVEYQKAINLGFAGAEVRHHLGFALGKLGRWEEAVVEYRLVVEINPKSAVVRHRLGYALMQLERWREAEIELRKAGELYPGSAEVWQHLADVLEELRNSDEAIALYEETHSLLISDQTVDDISKAKYFSFLGQQNAKEKQWNKAIDFYRQAVGLNPDSAELNHHLAYGLTQVEHWEEAIAYYQQAIYLKPESAVLYHQLGNVLAKFNRWSEAITQYCKALDLKPGLEEVKQSLIETLVKRNLLDIDSKNNFQGQFFNGVDVYDLWRQANEPREADLQQMRLTLELFSYQPLISIIMPVYDTPEIFLREAIESVLKQIYPYWELCIADDASTNQNVKSVLEEYIAKDSRIKVVFCTVNGHISAASNSALELATGEFVALLDHDDLLTPNALYEVAFLLNCHPEADMIYSDEDKIDENKKLKNPFFKPQWSPDSFLSKMYTCHLGVYRRKLLEEIGNFRIGYEGSQDYDLVLRFTEKTNKIFHIPKILYHWRIHSGSVTSGAEVKPYAYNAAIKALTEAIQRRGEPGKVTEISGCLGTYTIRYDIVDYKLVSIIIPTRDLSQILDNCLTSIFTKSVYPNYEVIVIDNGSVEKETVRVISKWKNKEPERFKCYVFDVPFNYPKINNYGVSKAEGDYLLFLNNDTEVITHDWIDAMVEQAQRDSIGVVGALLLYPDDT
ncbi:MAG: tetratricopeptide repeat protein, partial [Xenococcus sp. (in: cyanobacteria)]